MDQLHGRGPHFPGGVHLRRQAAEGFRGVSRPSSRFSSRTGLSMVLLLSVQRNRQTGLCPRGVRPAQAIALALRVPLDPQHRQLPVTAASTTPSGDHCTACKGGARRPTAWWWQLVTAELPQQTGYQPLRPGGVHQIALGQLVAGDIRRPRPSGRSGPGVPGRSPEWAGPGKGVDQKGLRSRKGPRMSPPPGSSIPRSPDCGTGPGTGSPDPGALQCRQIVFILTRHTVQINSRLHSVPSPVYYAAAGKIMPGRRTKQ